MKMKIVIAFLLGTACTAVAQKVLPFEPITPKIMSGGTINIPNDVKGKHTLLFVAFSEKSKESLVTWAEPVWNTFMVENPLNIEPYDVNLYLAIMLFGFAGKADAEVEKMVKKSLHPDWHKYILLHKGSLKPYSDEPDFKKRHVANVFLFNSKGELIYRDAGDYTEEKLHKLEKAINESN